VTMVVYSSATWMLLLLQIIFTWTTPWILPPNNNQRKMCVVDGGISPIVRITSQTLKRQNALWKMSWCHTIRIKFNYLDYIHIKEWFGC
jgi:hypothetical protein